MSTATQEEEISTGQKEQARYLPLRRTELTSISQALNNAVHPVWEGGQYTLRDCAPPKPTYERGRARQRLTKYDECESQFGLVDQSVVRIRKSTVSDPQAAPFPFLLSASFFISSTILDK
jgi:hypothetical protein